MELRAGIKISRILARTRGKREAERGLRKNAEGRMNWVEEETEEEKEREAIFAVGVAEEWRLFCDSGGSVGSIKGEGRRRQGRIGLS